MACTYEIVEELRELERKGLLNKENYNSEKTYEEHKSDLGNLKQEYFSKISLLNSLLENVPDSIYFKDKKGRFVELSKAKAEHLNTDKKDIIGKTDFDFYSFEEAKKMQDDEKLVMKDKKLIAKEEQITRPNGEKAWISVVKAPRCDINGNVLGIVGISRDITDKKISEEKLREKEEKLRNLFDNANDLIQSVNSKGYFEFVNRKWKKLLGYSDDEIKNLHFSDIIKSEYLPHCQQVFKRLSEGESFENIEVIFVTKNNDEIFIEGNINPIIKNGKFTGTRGIFRDITERKKAEKALHESQERYKTIFENSAVGIMMTDEKENIISWNKFTENILQMNKTDLQQKPVQDLYPKEEWTRIRKENIREKGMQHHLETKMYKKDGNTIDVDISVSVLKDKNQQIIGSIGVIKDITYQKEAEKALHESQERYKTIFENSAVGIMMTDEKENIISWNKFTENILQMNKTDLQQKPVQDLYPKEEWTRIRKENIREKGMQHHLETKMYKKDGNTIDVDISVSVLKDKNQQIIGSIGVFRNVTERKKMESKINEMNKLLKSANKNLEKKVQERTEEIRKLLKQKDEFIYQLGHDLKTPLTPLNSLLPVVRKKLEDEQSKKYLDLSIQNVKYMKNLVYKTLKLALFNSSSFELDLENVNAFEIIDRVIKNRSNAIDETNVEFENLVSSDTIVRADKLRFEELLDNLISNSVKYSKEEAKITVNAEEEKNKIKFSIKDTGCGMSKEQIEKIFDEFYKADESRHDFNSSGLGLSICKRIVEKHGGKIWAESKGLEKGSTFYFTLDIGQKNN